MSGRYRIVERGLDRAQCVMCCHIRPLRGIANGTPSCTLHFAPQTKRVCKRDTLGRNELG